MPNEDLPESIFNDREPPKLVTEKCITEIIKKEFGKNVKINKIIEKAASGGGENYASDLLRVQVLFQLEDKSEKSLTFVYKAMPKSEMGAQMIKMMGIFPREIEIYSTIIPKFEQLYKSFGKTVSFGPKCYYVSSDKESFVLEDLKPKNFDVGTRQIGLNKDQVKKTLIKLAEYHAASAVIYEKEGYSDDLMQGMFREEIIAPMEEMQKSILKVYINCLEKNEKIKPYINKIKKLAESSMEQFIHYMTHNPNQFNVLNHGDLWVNNIMFQNDENQNITQTYFIDYAAGKYGSPSQDLWYFLLSSCAPEFKIKDFDYLIKFYHENLIENLKLLQYPKELPKLVKLQIQLLENQLWAFSTVQGVLSIILLDPTELATMDNFIDESDAGIKFKMMTYSNPRYISALESLLPWLDNKGLLD